MVSANAKPFNKVIVVGAGPSGLLCALLLSKKGINVTLVEATEVLDQQPRATHYGPASFPALREAGVYTEIRKMGFIPHGVAWRKPDGSRLAGLDSSVMDDDNRTICLPLDKLGEILHDHLARQPTATILWSHEVTDVSQNQDTAWVTVGTKTGPQKLEADYVVGCDGAGSQVRRSLFGENRFPGMTWDKQIVATNVYYDFSRFGWADTSFIIHPRNWYMAAKITKDGLYRVTYGEDSSLTKEELINRQPMKFKEMLPGNPEPGEYRITNISPYRIHQRIVDRMRVGRIILAADAAHICNPFGGLGITGGMADIDAVYCCLLGIYEGKADEAILDKYSEIRRQKFINFVNPASSRNITLLFSTNPDTALEDSEFLKQCVKAEKDPEFLAQFSLMNKNLLHDFTEFYHKEPASSG